MLGTRMFHYRFNPADCYAEIDEMSIEERGKFLSKMCRDLVRGESDNVFIQKMIDEAHNYLDKKKNAGRSGGLAKSSSAKAKSSSATICSSTPLANSSTPLASSSSSSSSKNNEKKEPKSCRFTPPTIEEARDYFLHLKAVDESEVFYHHFQSAGWKLSGGQKMASWQSAIINWIKRDLRGVQASHKKAEEPHEIVGSVYIPKNDAERRTLETLRRYEAQAAL